MTDIPPHHPHHPHMSERTFQLSTLALSTVSGAFITLFLAWITLRGPSEERVKEMTIPIQQQQEQLNSTVERVDRRLGDIDRKLHEIDKNTGTLQNEMENIQEKIKEIQRGERIQR